MTNFKKQLDDQQKINKAVEEILKHFKEFDDYNNHYVSMAKAQTAIMALMNFYQTRIATNDKCDDVFCEDIVNFMWEVSEMLVLLKPFAEILGQIYGNED